MKCLPKLKKKLLILEQTKKKYLELLDNLTNNIDKLTFTISKFSNNNIFVYISDDVFVEYICYKLTNISFRNLCYTNKSFMNRMLKYFVLIEFSININNVKNYPISITNTDYYRYYLPEYIFILPKQLLINVNIPIEYLFLFGLNYNNKLTNKIIAELPILSDISKLNKNIITESNTNFNKNKVEMYYSINDTLEYINIYNIWVNIVRIFNNIYESHSNKYKIYNKNIKYFKILQ